MRSNAFSATTGISTTGNTSKGATTPPLITPSLQPQHLPHHESYSSPHMYSSPFHNQQQQQQQQQQRMMNQSPMPPPLQSLSSSMPKGLPVDSSNRMQQQQQHLSGSSLSYSQPQPYTPPQRMPSSSSLSGMNVMPSSTTNMQYQSSPHHGLYHYHQQQQPSTLPTRNLHSYDQQHRIPSTSYQQHIPQQQNTSLNTQSLSSSLLYANSQTQHQYRQHNNPSMMNYQIQRSSPNMMTNTPSSNTNSISNVVDNVMPSSHVSVVQPRESSPRTFTSTYDYPNTISYDRKFVEFNPQQQQQQQQQQPQSQGSSHQEMTFNMYAPSDATTTSPSKSNHQQQAPKKKKLKKENTKFDQDITTQQSKMEISVNNQLDDVSSALACSGAKLFPIACVQCRQRHKRCNRVLPSCSSCASKGIPCQYRTPRKKGRALNASEQFQPYTSLDQIKYIPQSAGEIDLSQLDSNSNSGSSSPNMKITTNVTFENTTNVKKRKKSEETDAKKKKKTIKTEQNLETVISDSNQLKPDTTHIIISPNNQSSPSLTNEQMQTNVETIHPVPTTVATSSQSTNIVYDNQNSMIVTAPNTGNESQNNINPSHFVNGQSIDMESAKALLNALSNPNMPQNTLCQLLSILLSSPDKAYIFQILDTLMRSADSNGVKDLVNNSYSLESYMASNENLNISAIKRKSIDFYDEVISLGYPLISTEIMEDALFSPHYVRGQYSPDQLALIYAIYAVTCQRFCEPLQAKQAYHRSLLELKDIKDRNNIIVVGAYSNLALYCAGIGDTDTAYQFITSTDIYLINRRKERAGIVSNDVALRFVGDVDENCPSMYAYLTEDEFKVEKLKLVACISGFLGSGVMPPLTTGYFALKGYTFMEEIGAFIAECIILFTGKISKSDLTILTKRLDSNTLPEYLSVLNEMENAYTGHEQMRTYSELQTKLATALLLCVNNGVRAWLLHNSGVKGPLVEEYARNITVISCPDYFLLLHAVIAPFVAKATEIHYETILDAESGRRSRDDLVDLYNLLQTSFSILVAINKRYPRVEKQWGNLLLQVALKLKAFMPSNGDVDKVLSVFTQPCNITQTSQVIQQQPPKQTQPNGSSDLSGVQFNFEESLRNFIITNQFTKINQ